MNVKRNAYTCEKCGGTIVTEDQDEGTTPFMLGCRATKDCGGMMQSHFYRGPTVESATPATFAWRKPSLEEHRKSSRAMQQHFEMGGLNIYPLDNAPSKRGYLGTTADGGVDDADRN